MKLQGKLSITRIQTTDDFIMRMNFQDEASRSRFLKVDISAGELLLAIASLADRPCEFNLGSCEYVGKQQEHKTIRIPGIFGDRMTFKEEYAKAVVPYEIDGWQADVESGLNHYREGKEGYEVIFRRWIGEGLGYERVK